LQTLSDSVFKKLTRLSGVKNIRSSIVLKTIHFTPALPLSIQ